MKGKTHIVAAMSATTIFSFQVLNIEPNAVEYTALMSVSAFGGLIADIDHGGSKLGSKIPIIPKILHHRGFTHTIYFIALLGAIFYWLFGANIYLYGFLIGMVSHLVCDILTPAGLKPFKFLDLFKFRIVIPIVQNEKIESVIYYLLIMIMPYSIISF